MKENQHIEFKQSWRDEYLQYICGFANAQGGTLYIGIDDKGEVCGIKNAHSLLENLPNQINQTIEQWGRGYEKIHDAFVREHLMQPTFEQARGGILVTIPREKFIAIQTGKSIGAELSTTPDDQTSQKSVQKSVQKSTEKQQAIYDLIKNKGSLEPLNEPLNELLNTERIALLLDIPYSTAKRIVKDLEKKGLIVRVGSKKNGHWEILS